ncbi:MAG: hypothetical protein QOE92_1735 [Chloroflexota bacterium]|nr:hypothetical protein [Chloroflexota bacterium]
MTPVQTMVATARQLLAGARPAVVAHDAWSAYGLELVLPETAILCVQASTVVDLLRDRGVAVFCLSEHVPAELVAGASAVEIFEHPAAREFSGATGPLMVIGLKPTERGRAGVERAGGRQLGSASGFAVARRFENKLAFATIAAELGLPVPAWQVVDPGDDLRFQSLAERLGPRLVVQGPRGNAGQRTWFVSDQAALDRVAASEGQRPLRVAEMVDGVPITATAVAGRDPEGSAAMVAVIEPCRQVTGVEWLTPMRLGSCGNAWGAPDVDAAGDAVRDVMARLGAALSDSGYQGMFGVDFVLGDRGPVVIETNPRLVASLPLATQLEHAAGRAPLLLHHLVAGLGGRAAGPVPTPGPLSPASQVIVRRLPGDPDRRPDLASGVYRVAPGAPPEFLRPAAYLADVAAPDEALLLVRAPGEAVTDGKEMARVMFQGPAGEGQPGLQELVRTVRGGG